MKKSKKALIAVLIVLIGIILEAATVVIYAYFSKKEIYDGYFSGEVELLFDRLTDDGLKSYTGDPDAEITDELSKNWGSKSYPYVISDVRHLYNLSELQRLGYFYKKFISANTTDFTHIPYFLVCTPDYAPVLIDGSGFKGITSIGTDKYPFIGSVMGVSSGETVTVDDKRCGTSAISNVKVSGNPANADVGLFGNIGYLGNSSDTTEGIFTGQVSTVSNLVLVDIQVTVKSNLWDTVTAFLEDIAINATEGHRYSFTDLHNTDNYNKVPHENHHIGILAGHAAYSKIEFISVYYSAQEIVAIDLKDSTTVEGVEANYLSSTGILGFIDNINPTFTEDANGNQSIVAGSGDSVDGISYGQTGGGGLASGIKAGYVLASNIYNTYHWTKNSGEDTTGTIKLIDAVDEGGKALCTEWIRDRILWGTEATGRYYFYDGVFTFALSDQADVLEPTWKDNTPDEFAIGQNNDSAWKVNYSQGNNAVVAYVKKITSDSDLSAAIADDKQIFIMQENENGQDIFLMSLYKQSTAGDGKFEVKYSTPGVTQKFGSDEFVNSLIESYEGGFELSNELKENNYTVESLVSALESGDLRAINVGITSSTVSLEQLKKQYKITPKTTGSYSFFNGNTPVQVNADGTLNEYYEYPIKITDENGEVLSGTYDGYIYYTTSTVLTRTYYTYYWQSAGSVVEIGTGYSGILDSSNAPNKAFEATKEEPWAGETIYTYTYNGKTYTGVVVNKTDGKFYNTGNKANANGAILTKPSDTTVEYFYRDVGKTNYYHSSDTNEQTPIAESSLTKTGNQSLAGQDIYTANGKTGVLLDRYPTYTFSSGNNYLRMIKAVFSNYGTHYALWNGTDSAANSASNFTHTFILFEQTPTSVSNSTQATLRFNSDGTCYIQYGIDNVGLYVNSTGSVFNTAESNSDAGTKLCIYTVEGTQDLNYGRITFDPIDDTSSETDNYSFSAGEFVLFATSSHTKDTNGYIDSTTTSYTVTEISSLNATSWQNGEGEPLTTEDLQKKFKMTKGITFGASFNLGGGTLPSAGIITAPVGTNGVEANIPQGCIAFRVNKASENIKIRVIVSVAVSEYYMGEDEYNLGNYTRYFNLWKMEEAGASTVQVFNATGENLLDRFVVPRSHPYEPGTTPASQNSEYITVTYNDKEYRCYLNGDRVLIAYEFNVNSTAEGTGTGVYCLGMSGIDLGGNTVADVPMEIVYFSADGVASAGRDGENASQIGTIDFVYDYNNIIVTVTEQSVTDNNGNEDYSNYYPSYCLLYFDTTAAADGSTKENPVYISVNNEEVIVRRYVIGESETPGSDGDHNTTTSRSTIAATLGGDGHVIIVQYSRYADNVIITQVTTQTQNE